MSPTFNYTDRKTIYQRHVMVSVPAGEVSEVVMRADLTQYEFPFDAIARVEANTRSTVWNLYEGSIRGLERPRRIPLGDIEDWHSVQWRLKVADRATGRLLGSSARFKLEDADDEASGLLRVRLGDTGQLLYRLELERHIGPTLVLSEPLWRERQSIRDDVLFRGALLPDIVRQVLRFAILYADLFDPDEAESPDNWFGEWTVWMDSYPGLEGFVDSLSDLRDDRDGILEWIEEAVTGFASNPDNRFLNKASAQLRGGKS